MAYWWGIHDLMDGAFMVGRTKISCCFVWKYA